MIEQTQTYHQDEMENIHESGAASPEHVEVKDVESTSSQTYESENESEILKFLYLLREKFFQKLFELKQKSIQLKDRLFVLCFWPFILILTGRLIFSSGGVVDFQKKERVLSEKETQLHQIQLENELLYDEIMKIQTDPQYQKQLVRENLGHVAGDEYVILFPNN